MKVRDQPLGLKKSDQLRIKGTIKLVELSLAALEHQQSDVPMHQRVYSTSSIIDAARMIRPSVALHSPTLWRNEEVDKIITEARQIKNLELDFRIYGSWSPPRQSSIRAVNRRHHLLKKWKVKRLAQYVIGLEELNRHCDERRQQLEVIDLLVVPWPSDRPYPMQPFMPSEHARRRYFKLLNRATKEELVLRALNLEQQATEQLAHIASLDNAHFKRQLTHERMNRSNGNQRDVAHAQTPLRRRKHE